MPTPEDRITTLAEQALAGPYCVKPPWAGFSGICAVEPQAIEGRVLLFATAPPEPDHDPVQLQALHTYLAALDPATIQLAMRVIAAARRVDSANSDRAKAQVQDQHVRLDYERTMGAALDALRLAREAWDALEAPDA